MANILQLLTGVLAPETPCVLFNIIEWQTKGKVVFLYSKVYSVKQKIFDSFQCCPYQYQRDTYVCMCLVYVSRVLGGLSPFNVVPLG